MGVRKSGPLGLYRQIDHGLDASFGESIRPARFGLPGPLGSYRWNDAVAGKPSSTTNVTRKSKARSQSVVAGTALDYEKLYRDIKKWEGVVGFMYLDTHKPPLVTVGTGNMLPDVEAAQALPFMNADAQRPATKEEIAAAYHKVASMQGGLRPVTRYKQKPNIEISDEESRARALHRLQTEFIPGIRQWVIGFDDFPLPAREALIDMAYNGGVGRAERVVKGKRQKASGLYQYRHLKSAIDQGDWEAASRACHSSSSRPARNEWRKNLFLEAARMAPQKKGGR
jgi:hypothetical protein